ncbi:MAG: hypothetical protein ACK46X_15620 [Candidatus Sericytochromatia bacterium]
MDDIRGLKPFLFFAPNWKHVLLVGLAVLAVMAFLAWFGRKRQRPDEEMGPAAAPFRALPARTVKEQLDALKASRFIEQGRIKDFHAELSAIIRGYLGARFHLPGRRLTTTELLDGLERQPIEAPVYQLIADFLPECDLVKFADARPSRAEMDARLATAYYLVERLGDARDAEEPDEPEAPAPGPERQGGSLDVVG